MMPYSELYWIAQNNVVPLVAIAAFVIDKIKTNGKMVRVVENNNQILHEIKGKMCR